MSGFRPLKKLPTIKLVFCHRIIGIHHSFIGNMLLVEPVSLAKVKYLVGRALIDDLVILVFGDCQNNLSILTPRNTRQFKLFRCNLHVRPL